MGSQSSPQLHLGLKNLSKGECVMNGFGVILVQNSFLIGDIIHEFSDGSKNFLNNPDIKLERMGDEDEERKIRRFCVIIDKLKGKGDRKAINLKQKSLVQDQKGGPFLVEVLGSIFCAASLWTPTI